MKQMLMTMYKRATYGNSSGRFSLESPDAFIYTMKDLETKETELHVIPNPTISYYTSKTPRSYHAFSMPVDELNKIVCRYSDREKDMCERLGLSDQFFNAKKLHTYREFKDKLMAHPDLYFADVDIEDYYKTMSLIKNNEQFGKIGDFKLGFSDTEVDTSKCDGFPNPQIAPVPIILITTVFQTEKVSITYILKDDRCFQDQLDVIQHPQEFIKEYLDPKMLERGFTYRFKMYESELDMIKDYFHDVHEYKPDFIGWWNMNFDIQTILNRLKNAFHLSKAEIANIICHPDVPEPFRYFEYALDPLRLAFESDDAEDEAGGDEKKKSKARPHPSRYVDWFTVPGYTQWYCQMALFSNMRKRYQLPSYRLDDIGKDYGGMGKYDLHANGLTHQNWFQYFKIYLAYNIRDVHVQYEIEEKQHDLPTFIIFAGNTRLSMALHESINIKNTIMLYLLTRERPEITGNNIKYDIHEKIPGAIVGRPELMEMCGINISGLPSYVFEGCVDLDASSLYPSNIIEANISKTSLFGRAVDVVRRNGEQLKYGVVDKDEDTYLFSKLQCIDSSLFDFCKDYFDLPGPYEIIAAMEKYMSTVA